MTLELSNSPLQIVIHKARDCTEITYCSKFGESVEETEGIGDQTDRSRGKKPTRKSQGSGDKFCLFHLAMDCVAHCGILFIFVAVNSVFMAVYWVLWLVDVCYAGTLAAMNHLRLRRPCLASLEFSRVS